MNRFYRPLIAILGSALSLSLVLTACGDDDSSARDQPVGAMSENMDSDDMEHDHSESSPVVDGARRVEVNATSFVFDPDEITVNVGEDVAIVLSSDDLLHDFTIDEINVHVAADRGEIAEGGLRAEAPGEYTFYCTVAGHREAGMEGTLIVEAPE
ncbi:MAG: cupredoxin domain-containing protein [Acidimicrobiia bacterium]